MTERLILAFCLLMLWGCGLLGGQGGPKEQLNGDIDGKTIKAQRANNMESTTEWNFKDDSLRCFAPVDGETKITESNADVTLNISAVRLSGSSDTPTLFGKILLHYKKDNGKWVLDNIEPKDVRTNEISGDAFSKYVDLQMPLCNYFKYTTVGK